VIPFAQLRRDFIEDARATDVARQSLDNAAAPLLKFLRWQKSLAVTGVPTREIGDLRNVYGYIIEPCYHLDVRLVIQADRDLDDLDPARYVEEEYGYPWTLERLRHVAKHYRRRTVTAGEPPLTPIEEDLLAALRRAGLSPRLQYGVSRFRLDFAFPERALAVEADGRGWHDADRDAARDLRLSELGWETMRFSGSRIWREADACAQEILTAYERRPPAVEYSELGDPTPESRPAPTPASPSPRSWWRRLLDWLFGGGASGGQRPARPAVAPPQSAPRRETPLPRPPEPERPWRQDLDASQMRAVMSAEGVSQVIAPAGSGKTRVLVARVQELLSRGVPANRILCTTFNAASRKELKQRLGAAGASEVDVHTFHSLGLEIITKQGLARGRTGTLSYGQWRRLCAAAMRDDPDGEWVDAPVASEIISGYKIGDMASPAVVASRAHTRLGQTLARIYSLYEEQLEESDLNDFDDLIVRAVEVLRRDAAVRDKWQARWECVLIDEYQDIEPAQELLIKLMAAPQDCMMVVGDEDQCIYSWRRASVERIVQLDLTYPGLQRTTLETSYRCPPPVVAAASRLIVENRRRFPKPINPDPRREGQGQIVVGTYDRFESGAAAVADMLATESPSETVVLARTSRLLRILAGELASRGIAFRAAEKVLRPSDVERTVLAYLRLLSNPAAARDADVDQVFRVPNSYLPNDGEVAVADALRNGALFSTAIEVLKAEDWRMQKLRQTAERLGALRGAASAKNLIVQLRGAGGLDRHYADQERMSGVDQDAIDSLDWMESAAGDASVADFVAVLERRAKILTAADADDAVELTTIHGAKGREWDTVILFGADHSELPHCRGLEAAETPAARDEFIEDERRLAYVAFTRARQKLVMLYQEGRPSQYLVEAGIVSADDIHRATPASPLRGEYTGAASQGSDAAPARSAAEAKAAYGRALPNARPKAGPKPKQTSKLARAKAMDAKCPVCQWPIKEGEWICKARFANGRERWVHARCAEK
jgi:superfamily I DNA/RNA helicase/very-short-patch-repair endonuclease